MKKHIVVMDVEGYFQIKNYLVGLKQSNKLDNDKFIQKFYQAFAVDSCIKIDRGKRLFDNPICTVEFYLDNNQTMLSTVGLFCREHAIDQNRENPHLAKALFTLKDYISSELMDLLNL